MLFKKFTWLKAFFTCWTNELVMLSHVFQEGFFIIIANLAWITVMSKTFFGWLSLFLFLHFLSRLCYLWLMGFQVIFKGEFSLKSSFTSLKRTNSDDVIIFLNIYDMFVQDKLWIHNWGFLGSLWFRLTTELTSKGSTDISTRIGINCFAFRGSKN